MFCIITPAFIKVKYKFQYSKKSSQPAHSHGPSQWPTAETELKTLKIQNNFENQKIENFQLQAHFSTFFVIIFAKINPDSNLW